MLSVRLIYQSKDGWVSFSNKIFTNFLKKHYLLSSGGNLHVFGAAEEL